MCRDCREALTTGDAGGARRTSNAQRSRGPRGRRPLIYASCRGIHADPSMTCGSVTYSERCDFRCGVNYRPLTRPPSRSVLPLPAQPVDATQALSLSAGVSNCKVSRGRSLIRPATRCSTPRRTTIQAPSRRTYSSDPRRPTQAAGLMTRSAWEGTLQDSILWA
jgi:hypothetical protein